ncbi:CBS domain-containing protein, partial [Planktothrix sp. FACHB-1355]
MNLPEPQLAINRHPLTVSPDTPLLDVLAKMNQIHGGECTFFNKAEAKNKNLYSGQPSFMPHPGNYKVNNCALIVEEGKIRGIITERDVVKLVARGQNLAVPIANVMTKEVITLAESEFKDVFLALSLLRDNQIRHLPSIDDAENLVGVVTAETIREVLQPVNLLTMRRVADVMTTKVIHAPASSSVLNLAQLMADNCVSCVVIANSEANTKQAIPIGIVTERDIVQLQILGLQIEDIQAEKVMS